MQTSHTVHIAAPPEKVWAAEIDVERWPEFTPQFKKIELIDSPFGMGVEARVRLTGISSIWTVTEFEPDQRFTWGTNMLPGMHFAARHEIEPDGDGTKATHTLETSGPLAAALGLLLNGSFRRSVEREAEGMKAFCEGA